MEYCDPRCISSLGIYIYIYLYVTLAYVFHDCEVVCSPDFSGNCTERCSRLPRNLRSNVLLSYNCLLVVPTVLLELFEGSCGPRTCLYPKLLLCDWKCCFAQSIKQYEKRLFFF